MTLDDKLTALAGQDPSLAYLRPVLDRLLDLLVHRGASRNCGGVTVKDYIFRNGDIDGIFMPRMKMLRADAIIQTVGKDVPRELLQDSLDDGTNYLLMYLCCRAERDAKRVS